jgi:hypothetical protein
MIQLFDAEWGLLRPGPGDGRQAVCESLVALCTPAAAGNGAAALRFPGRLLQHPCASEPHHHHKHASSQHAGRCQGPELA